MDILNHITPLQWYLLTVNVLAVIAFAINWLIFRNSERGPYAHGWLNAFSIIGAPIGMMIAFFLFDSRNSKENSLWRIIALVSLVGWALVLVGIYGPWTLGFGNVNLNDFWPRHKVLVVYLAAINVVTLVVYIVDKIKAIRDSRRIPEVTLLVLTAIGGSVGAGIGMLVARHKIRSTHFRVGVPLLLIMHVAILAFLLFAGVL